MKKAWTGAAALFRKSFPHKVAIRRTTSAALTLAIIVVASLAFAQEGHPLVGTWSGDWGPTPTHRNQVTIVMEYDGKGIKGIINPGPDVVPMKVVTLDSTKWIVHIEADARDSSGNPVHFVIDGKLDNILSYNRTLTGTWSHGNMKGDFKVRRD